MDEFAAMAIVAPPVSTMPGMLAKPGLVDPEKFGKPAGQGAFHSSDTLGGMVIFELITD